MGKTSHHTESVGTGLGTGRSSESFPWMRCHTSRRWTGKTPSAWKPRRTLPPAISSTVMVTRGWSVSGPPTTTTSRAFLFNTNMADPPCSWLTVWPTLAAAVGCHTTRQREHLDHRAAREHLHDRAGRRL